MGGAVHKCRHIVPGDQTVSNGQIKAELRQLKPDFDEAEAFLNDQRD